MSTRKVPNTDPSITPVIFRKWSDGLVIALFPYEPGTADPGTCQSFAHVGQHGSADPQGVIRRTKPASMDEAWDLICELTSEPYRYRPIRFLRRTPPDAFAYRATTIATQRAQR